MNKLILLILFCIPSNEVETQTDWVLIDNTSLQDANGNSTISGNITEGYVFKTLSGHYYVTNPLTFQIVFTFLPDVKIYQKGTRFMLIIDDFNEPVYCRKPDLVIKSRISGEFNGWEGETTFKLINGQIWKQFTYSYLYHYAYSPGVIIYKINGVWYIKVENLEQTIPVIKIN